MNDRRTTLLSSLLSLALVSAVMAARLATAAEYAIPNCTCPTTCTGAPVQGEMQVLGGGGGGLEDPPEPGSIDASYCNPGLCNGQGCNYCIPCVAGDLGWFGCMRNVLSLGCMNEPYCAAICCHTSPAVVPVPVLNCVDRCIMVCYTN